MKVASVVGTRPEIIRLSRVIAALDRHMDHVLIHTGQNYDYELNGIFFEDLEIRKPDHFLEAAGKSAAETIGKIIAKSDQVLGKIQPDAMLVLGDTNSCLAAISAKRRKIPVFHMEAGNRCFDERVPEEINRKIAMQFNRSFQDLANEATPSSRSWTARPSMSIPALANSANISPGFESNASPNSS